MKPYIINEFVNGKHKDVIPVDESELAEMIHTIRNHLDKNQIAGLINMLSGKTLAWEYNYTDNCMRQNRLVICNPNYEVNK